MRAARRVAAIGLAILMGFAGGAAAQPVPGWPLEPTAPALIDAMLRLAEVTPEDDVYDLGCGDGRAVIAAARKFGARALGIDSNLAQIDAALWHARLAGVGERVRFRHADPFDAALDEATVVVLYGLPKPDPGEWSVLASRVGPGVRIVALDAEAGPGWPPERTLRIGDRNIQLWRVPGGVR
jgi:SAM-dependent methyltransferase